jgi:gamma-glutamylputrescine oxidase
MQASYWEQTTPFAKIGAVAPPIRTDVLIVGAGLCGSWLAYFLKKKNPKLHITIADQSMGYGASSKNAGFLSPGNISEWLDDLRHNKWTPIFETFLARLEGLAIVRREFGLRILMDDLGSTDFDPVTDDMLELMMRFNTAIDERELPHAFKQTEIKFSGKTYPVITSPQGHGINPVELLNALHTDAKENGVQLLFDTQVQHIGNGTAELSSHIIEYDYAFLCTNARARVLNPSSTVLPTRAQVIVTKPCDISAVPHTLGFQYEGYDYFRPVGNNRLLYGGGRHLFKKREATDSFEPTQEIRDYLLDQIGKVLCHNNFEIDTHWAGVEGLRGGQHVTAAQLLTPTIIDTKTEEIAGFSTWGVTLSPFAASRKAVDF